MRITFVLPGFPSRPIGGFRVVYEYANRLASRGHHVSVVHPRRLTLSPPKNLYRWVHRRAARILDLFFPPDVDWQPIDRRVSMLHVPDLRARWVPDGEAVFATAWQTAEYVVSYPTSKGKKFYLVQDFDPWLGARERLEETWRWPLKKVTVSRWLYEKVCSAGASQNDVVNIPNGIDHERLRLTAETDRPAGTIAMFYGLPGYKAAQDGLDALRMVKARFPDLTVTIFGHTDPRADKIPSWIVHRGRVSESELVRIYNGSRIFVCSSAAEGFALPPAEAMACGCAVASTDCGGVREFAEHEVTALLSPPGDPEALARNIARLLDDDGLRQRLAIAGYERIQTFTWERSTDELEQFIEKVVAGGMNYAENSRALRQANPIPPSAPLVYVVILNYNGAQMTLDCLRSVRALDYSNFRVLIVDNGSTDGSAGALAHAIRSINDPRLELLLNQKNEGYAGGNNRGIEKALAAGAQYVLVLNNDTIAHPGCLKPLVEAMEGDPSIAICGGRVFNVSAGGTVSSEIERPFSLFTASRPIFSDRSELKGVRDVDHVRGVAMLLRAGLMRKIGLFDPKFFLLYEDTDLCYRAREAGYRVCLVPTPGVRHLLRATLGKFRPMLFFYLVRNRAWFIRRHGRIRHRIVFTLVSFAYYYPRILAARVLRKESHLLAPILKGIWQGHWRSPELNPEVAEDLGSSGRSATLQE